MLSTWTRCTSATAAFTCCLKCARLELSLMTARPLIHIQSLPPPSLPPAPQSQRRSPIQHSSREWNDNEYRPACIPHIHSSSSPHPFSVSLLLPCTPSFSVNLSKHSSCNLLTLKNTDSICIHEPLIVTQKSNHSAGCWQEDCHLEWNTNSNTVFSSPPAAAAAFYSAPSFYFVSQQLLR